MFCAVSLTDWFFKVPIMLVAFGVASNTIPLIALKDWQLVDFFSLSTFNEKYVNALTEFFLKLLVGILGNAYGAGESRYGRGKSDLGIS